MAYVMTEEHKRKIGAANAIALKGRHTPLEVRRKQANKTVPLEMRMRISKAMKGPKNHNWSKTPSYSSIHYYLYQNYGKAIMCENPECDGSSKIFNWAKKHNVKYDRKRENFLQLCRKCHTRYDLDENNVHNRRKTLPDVIRLAELE